MRNGLDVTSYVERLRALLPESGESIPGDGNAGDDPLTTEDAHRIDRPHRAQVSSVKRFALSHVKALSALAMAAVILATWSVMKAKAIPLDDPVPTPSISVPSQNPTPAQTPQQWMVHVLGAVNAPGVVRVTQGSRVMDAIAAAGGLAEGADPGELNLAAEIADGAQIIIGTAEHPQGEVRVGTTGTSDSSGASGGSGQGSSSAKINLNSATTAQLDTLPGVGEVTASSILAWREKNGPFTNVAQLQEVDGIGPKTYAQIEPYVCV